MNIWNKVTEHKKSTEACVIKMVPEGQSQFRIHSWNREFYKEKIKNCMSPINKDQQSIYPKVFASAGSH